MKRQEQLNEAWCKSMGKCSTEIMQALAFALRWADAHPDISMASALAYDAGRNDVIEEACEWLEQNAYHYCDDIDTLHESALIGDFRYAMKGGEK